MEEAIQFARNTGFLDVIFESDSLSVIQSLYGSLIIFNIISGSLQAICFFRQVQFVYVPHTGNKAAHGLAQYARNISNFVTLIKENPCIIERSLALDVLCLSLSE